MSRFMESLRACKPQENHGELFWLGQAGFAVKTHGGKVIAIDPYLSDYVMRLFPENGLGFKRLMPPPCTAEELSPDILLISHEHGDHFDGDSIAALMKDEKTRVYASAPVVAEMAKMGLDMSRVTELHKGEKVALPECELTPVDCDHGELAPEALGFLLDFGFTKLYYAGDTSLTLDRLALPLAAQPETAILPINGAFGNLNGTEAAEYAALLHAKRCVPCHFWTFPLHHGDPQEIIDAMPVKAPGCELCLLCQEESVTL